MNTHFVEQPEDPSIFLTPTLSAGGSSSGLIASYLVT